MADGEFLLEISGHLSKRWSCFIALVSVVKQEIVVYTSRHDDTVHLAFHFVWCRTYFQSIEDRHYRIINLLFLLQAILFSNDAHAANQRAGSRLSKAV